MREIGSEFWDVPTRDVKCSCFPENTQWFLSGRSALKAIIQGLKGCHTVAMPSWCCDSMVKPFVDTGFEVHFYPVFSQDRLNQEITFTCDVLFLMDYFGYSARVPDLRSYNGIIIRDITHSIFSSDYSDADYYFGSLRKWCGIWTGGYAWAKNGHCLCMENGDDYGFTHLREKAMQLKNSYIHECGVTDKVYLKLFEEAEACLEKVSISPASERDVRLSERIDIEFIRSRRRANAKVLRERFHDWLLFPEMKKRDCPMFVPVLVPNRNRNSLRKHLIENEIYCPVHWPASEYHQPDEKTQFIYDNELSLVCDQRYTEDDMHRIVDAIESFWKEA